MTVQKLDTMQWVSMAVSVSALIITFFCLTVLIHGIFVSHGRIQTPKNRTELYILAVYLLLLLGTLLSILYSLIWLFQI